MKKVDIDKLRKIIEDEKSNVEEVLYKDTFALACYLSLKGESVAGKKLCRGILNALGNDQRKTYFDNIVATIEGNELEYAQGVWAHLEINKLFDEFESEELALAAN